MLSSEKISMIRTIVLGLTGLITLTYAILAFSTGRPDPIPFWIPGLAGVSSFLIIWISVGSATKHSTEQTFDEGYLADSHKAQRIGYWIALFLYPVFGLLLYVGVVDSRTAFATMGTLTGAAFLLVFVWFDVRGRL